MSTYSTIVRKLRIGLPIGAVVIVVLIIAWPFAQKMMGGFSFKSANQSADQLTIVKPRYVSKDQKDNPFEVTADRAVQKTNAPDVVELERPAAEITFNKNKLSASATNGVYDKAKKNLALTGDVRMKRDDGLNVETGDTMVDLVTNSATSDAPTVANNDRANVKGAGFNWDGQNTILTVKGPAKMIMLPKNTNANTDENAEPQP